jgi:uncharacterized protein
MRWIPLLFVLILPPSLFASPELVPAAPLRLLVLSKTAGFRHDSIPNAIKAFAEMSRLEQWSVTFTEDAGWVRDDVLGEMDVVVFLMTSGDILDADQESAFQSFIRRGGGFVAVHSGGTDTEYEWPWYRDLIGASFVGHPPVCEGHLVIEDPDHPATRHFDGRMVLWEDEFYSFDRNPREQVHVLVSVDEFTYDVDNNPWFAGVDLRMGDHPLVWCRVFEEARIVQTALGHTVEVYDDPRFRKHLAGAVNWVSHRE